MAAAAPEIARCRLEQHLPPLSSLTDNLHPAPPRDGVEERRLGGDLAAVAGRGGEVHAAQGDDK